MATNLQEVTAFLKKYPVAIGCGALSLILLAGSIWRGATAGDRAATLKQKEAEGQTILDDVRNGSNLAEQFEALQTDVREMESRLVRGSERARNQQYFYRLESDTGVKELSLQPTANSGPPKRGPKPIYQGIGYAISVQGTYRQILDFLGRLESGPHFYRFVSASVSRGQNNAAATSPAITLTLTLELLGLP